MFNFNKFNVSKLKVFVSTLSSSAFEIKRFFNSMLKDSGNAVTQQIYEKSEICNGSMFTNLVAAAVKKDRAIFTSDLRCRMSSADVSYRYNMPSPLYSRTGGCFKQYQVKNQHLSTACYTHAKKKWKFALCKNEILLRNSEKLAANLIVVNHFLLFRSEFSFIKQYY